MNIHFFFRFYIFFLQVFKKNWRDVSYVDSHESTKRPSPGKGEARLGLIDSARPKTANFADYFVGRKF